MKFSVDEEHFYPIHKKLKFLFLFDIYFSSKLIIFLSGGSVVTAPLLWLIYYDELHQNTKLVYGLKLIWVQFKGRVTKYLNTKNVFQD